MIDIENLGKNNNIVKELTKKSNIKQKDYGHHYDDVLERGMKQQCDLMEIIEGDINFIFIVVDVYDRKIDCEAIKNKRAETVLTAYKKY